MPDKMFLTAKDIIAIMGIAESTAYKLIRQLNDELRAQGYITIQGKVPTIAIQKISSIFHKS